MSGTEPLLRVYAEAASPELVAKFFPPPRLLFEAQAWTSAEDR